MQSPSVFVLFACVCVDDCVGWGGYYCFLLVVARPVCSVGHLWLACSAERCSVSGVKQAQSRARADAMGTNGSVSLRLATHAHILDYKTLSDTDVYINLYTQT